MRRTWKLIAISGPILAAGSLFVSGLAYRSIQNSRADRIRIANRADYLGCTRDNRQDRRDRSQDALLLHLLNASINAPLPPNTPNTTEIRKIREVFEQERSILKNRVKPPDKSLCEDLPGAPKKSPKDNSKTAP